jgi:hypothetical protein
MLTDMGPSRDGGGSKVVPPPGFFKISKLIKEGNIKINTYN